MADEPSPPSPPAPAPPPHIHRPIPRRAFDLADEPTHAAAQATPPSPPDSRRSSDFLAQLNARLLRTYNARADDADDRERDRAATLRNRSFLNLNSSTLFGIYDDAGAATAGERSVAETPWGTGAATPAHLASGTLPWEVGMGSPDAGLGVKQQARRGTQPGQPESTSPRPAARSARPRASKYAILAAKLAALYLFGSVYGLIVSHLHETRQLAAVHIESVNYRSGLYLASWGLFGVALGSLLPYVDLVWGSQKADTQAHSKDSEKSDSPISEQINDIVRSVCAFVGIAFAIRRLPWQSTLQLTLTLALVNPALWYILDRSKPGLSFSLVVTSILTSFIVLSNPDVMPSPSLPVITNATRFSSSSNGGTASSSSSNTRTSMTSNQHAVTVDQVHFAGMLSYENLAAITWVGSVLFCSCVCFGSIGRRLALLEDSEWGGRK